MADTHTFKHVVAGETVVESLLRTNDPSEIACEQLRATYAIAERLERLVGAVEDLNRTIEVTGSNVGVVLQDINQNIQ
jgi:hypothetical protein